MAFGVAVYLWLDLRTARTTLSSLERAQVVMDTQLALAGEIQRRLLPGGADHAGSCAMGGPAGAGLEDRRRLLRLHSVRNDSTLVVVGDVSGKGIPAALLQASAH